MRRGEWLIKSLGAQYDLKCEERQLIALMMVTVSETEAGADGRKD